MYGENFSRGVELIMPARGEPRMCSDVSTNSNRAFSKPYHKASPRSGLHPGMSSEFEYRRLAAACLDLAKRAAHADKSRLLLIAEAWLNLAGRVARKNGNASRQNGDSAGQALVMSGSRSTDISSRRY
jgi:hypothetical protein